MGRHRTGAKTFDGEAAYRNWLARHGLTDADVSHDLREEIDRMVGGGDFVRYSIRASRLAELEIAGESDSGSE